MREKILAKLVAKYPGLSKRFLGLWADKLVSKVTEEDKIQGVIDELDNLPVSINDLASEFQKEGDHRVAEAKKEFDKKNPPKPPKDKTDDDPKPPDSGGQGEDTPAWAKGLMKEILELKTDKLQTSMKARATEKLKDVPADYWSEWALPDKEEDLDGFVEKVNTKWTVFKQEQINKGLMVAAPPAGGGDNGKPTSTGKEEADIKAWAEKEKSKETSSTKK